MEEYQMDLSHEAEDTLVTRALAQLARLTHQLRMYGQTLAALTIITVGGSIAFAFYRVFRVVEAVILVTLVLIAASALQALLISVFFESRRKQGDVLFKEISDELQWHVRFEREKNVKASLAPTIVSQAPEHRPGFDARLVLRSFAQTSDLPLVPGAYGPLVYAVINIVSIAFTAVSLLPFFGKY
jgi:hypothetical protein